jgi:thioesterase domain-containing protein/acyl carrier protein
LQIRGRDENGTDVPAVGADDPQEFPMSSGQLRVWITEQVMGSSAANNLCYGLRLSGAVNTSALELSLLIVIRRHEALRTTFDFVGGRPIQLVHQKIQTVLNIVDLSHAPQPEQAAYAAACEAAHDPFDLKRAPPLRFVLLGLGREQHVLLCTLHHIVADGWSLGLFARELAACYAAISEGEVLPLKPLPLQYVDFALWEQDWLESEDFQSELADYAGLLAGAPPPPHLAETEEVGANPSVAGASRSVKLPSELMSAINATAPRLGVTAFVLSLAAFQLLLWQLSGREDQVVGVPVARRDRTEFEDTIGLFANLVVVRADLSGDPTLADLLGRTRSAMLDALMHENVPFERLVRALHPARSISGNPIFQILFATVPPTTASERFGALTTAPYVVEAAAAAFDLSVTTIEEPSGAAWLRAEYRTGTFNKDQIKCLLDQYIHLLAQVVARPEARISQFGTLLESWPIGQRMVTHKPSTPALAGGPMVNPPSDLELELTLADLWEKVMRCRVPSTDSDFFDLGGDSLQAVTITHEISRALGRQIPVSLLFREPSIRGMVRWLCTGDRLRFAALPLSLSGTRPPLFIGGADSRLRNLSRALEPEQPSFQLDIFALQEQRLLAGQPLLETLPEIAAEFIRDILMIQPADPYFLAGQCEGGLLALEIALQLQASGRKVTWLAQLDTPVDGFFRRRHWTRRPGIRLRQAIAMALSRRRFGLLHRSLEYLRRRWPLRLCRKRPLVTPEEERLAHIWLVIWQAVRDYRQAVLYRGEIQVFRAEDRFPIFEDVASGWERRAERIRVQDVPGTHNNYLSKHTTQRRIAEEIERELRQPVR